MKKNIITEARKFGNTEKGFICDYVANKNISSMFPSFSVSVVIINFYHFAQNLTRN